ncbi:protein ABHD18-like isoform X4 [Homarus americanus]|uniref:protein ABHD18-like isoform X4 n=1 Tax=Homarus americanus TaxID=6706 RepID=UPI001C482F1F|nr:protein ABHD18-like isoform X4 [Homarus americanus]
MVSRIDQIYRSILLTKFFVRGWGKPENLRRLFAFRKILSNRETCQQLVDKNHPITITKEVDNGDHIVLEAEFISPFVAHLPGLLPKESEKATFQLVFPKVWRTHLKPTCLHLAGTGDHGFWRRKMLMGKPLLDESGIASAILENPFYGCRKPKDQIRSSLHNVSDLFVMGGCLVLESLAIFNWCERLGFGPLGITGISMGGHGVLSGAINWEMLKNQYFSNEVFREELFDMIQSPEGHFPVYHEVGQKFARDFPGSLSHVEQLMQDQGQNLRQHKHKLDDSHSDNKNEIRNSEFKSDDIRSAQNTRKSSQVEGSGSESQYYTGTVHNVAAGRGGGPLGISLSLPRFNILQSFGLSKSKVSKGQPAQANKDAATSSNHILVGYRKSKSNISKPVHEFTPVGIRPKSSANTKTVKFDPYMEVKDTLTWEAVQFMRGVMDECTHLGNFSVPVDPSLVIIVAAENDGYMPRDGIIPLNEIWPGSQVRTIRTGHVTAYLFNHQVFRQAIKDSFDQVIAKYYS